MRAVSNSFRRAAKATVGSMMIQSYSPPGPAIKPSRLVATLYLNRLTLRAFVDDFLRISLEVLGVSGPQLTVQFPFVEIQLSAPVPCECCTLEACRLFDWDQHLCEGMSR